MSATLVTDSSIGFKHTYSAYLEKIVPDLDKESPNFRHVSAVNVVREHQQDYLGLLKPPQYPTTTSPRPNLSGIGSETVDTSMRHTRGREERPWLANLSHQYIPPQHSSAHSTPRISSYSLLPRIRASNFTDDSQRPLDEWAISQKSYLTPLLPTSSHPHVAPDPDNLREFTYVKHEPDVDLATPPPRLGLTYLSHQAPPVPAFVSFAFFKSSYHTDSRI